MNNIIYKPFHTKESYDNNQAKVFTKWFSGSLLMDQTLVYLVDKHPNFNVETTCFKSDSGRWEPVCMPQLRNPELTV